ncbi:MAG: hypothetical protein HFH90_15500 [Lachnospiraceae bacterium]|jgi:hypothetical protein|nr:hypothetical protein [Lachnospiraceae bacterium]
MGQGIFDILVEKGTNERLDEIAMVDEAYVKASKELDDAILEKENLLRQLHEVDKRVSALYGKLMASYTKLAYEQGFKDMVEILTRSQTE